MVDISQFPARWQKEHAIRPFPSETFGSPPGKAFSGLFGFAEFGPRDSFPQANLRESPSTITIIAHLDEHPDEHLDVDFIMVMVLLSLSKGPRSTITTMNSAFIMVIVLGLSLIIEPQP